MSKKNYLKIGLFILLIEFFANVRFAHAYIDAGTGSYIFQLLIAGLLGGMFFIKKILRTISEFFKNIFSSKRQD
jgi:hypothetical protein